MARKCTICNHTARGDIDGALVRGDSFRHIAARFDVSTTALQRHKQAHIPESLVKASEAAEIARADDLLSQVRTLHERALGILEKTEDGGEYRTALAAIREARGCVELLAKLLGELQDGTTVNVLVTPEWVALRTTLYEALLPFPEARQSVTDALVSHER